MAGHDNLAYAPVHAPVTVVARFLAKDGQEARVEETLRAMVAPTRAEEACISYDLYRSRDQSAVFYMLENWRSREGLAAHMGMPYFAAMDTALTDTLAEHYTVSVVEMASPAAR